MAISTKLDGIAAVSQVRMTRANNFGLRPQSAMTAFGSALFEMALVIVCLDHVA
jgi:hypothetical protein